MRPATTGYDVQAEDVADPKFEAETDEKMFGVVEDFTYEGLMETEEAMIDAVVRTSLTDIPLPDLSRVSSTDVAPGTDADRGSHYLDKNSLYLPLSHFY